MPSAALHPDRCWFWQLGMCDGRIDRAHLLPKQRIKRLFRDRNPDALFAMIWDSRVWIPACRKHHTMLDSKRLTIAREELPLTLWEYAAEHDLTWMVDADYQPRAAA
jgi:hypothetical protein